MELKIVDFIKTHSNWEELLTSSPYNLTIKRDGKLILFKYNQIDSDFNEEICCEARGLILEEGTWKVVRFAFKKFFNLGESFAAKIDWDSAVGNEKLDGSLISTFFYDGKWNVATNSTINAYNAELQNSAATPYKNFGQLFETAAEKCNFNWRNLDPNYIYTFELCSPANKVVLNYSEPTLYHILTRSATTLEEVEMDIGVQKPKQYNLSSQKEYEELVSSMDDTHEGIVVRDNAGNRVKIKTLSYFTLHHMANNGVLTLERAIDLIKANDTDEFTSYFPEYVPYFNKIEQALFQIKVSLNTIDFIVQKTKAELEEKFSEKVAKKEFAKIYSSFELSHIYFAAYDGALEKKINNMSTSQFIKFFKPFFKGVE